MLASGFPGWRIQDGRDPSESRSTHVQSRKLHDWPPVSEFVPLPAPQAANGYIVEQR